MSAPAGRRWDHTRTGRLVLAGLWIDALLVMAASARGSFAAQFLGGRVSGIEGERERAAGQVADDRYRLDRVLGLDYSRASVIGCFTILQQECYPVRRRSGDVHWCQRSPVPSSPASYTAAPHGRKPIGAGDVVAVLDHRSSPHVVGAAEHGLICEPCDFPLFEF